MAVLGLDLGTSAAKAVVLGDDGTVLGRGSAPCRSDAPRPGWMEADPEDWLVACGDAVGQAMTASGDTSDEPVRSLGLAGQMHSVVLCDQDGRPSGPALLWADQRATAELARYQALPLERRAALANPLVPGMAGPMLAWIHAHAPERLTDARWALQPKDWLRLRLCGQAATEPSDASATLLWDIPADHWALDVAATLDVAADLLPPVLSSDEVAGRLTPSGAQALGLRRGLPVTAGAGDTAAALLGAGAVTSGARLLNVGTGAQLATVIASVEPSEEHKTHRYRTTGNGWYAMAAVQNAGLALRWALDILGLDWHSANELAFDGAYEPSTLMFVPHLTGERTPFLDPHARGAFVGLRVSHDRGHLMRSVYEGVAHAIRHARDALDLEIGRSNDALRLLGGGSMQPGFRQLLADTLGEPLEVLDRSDATVLGAALLAGATVPPPEIRGLVEPSPEATDGANERHQHWLDAVGSLPVEAFPAAACTPSVRSDT
jgi:xylulokinase